MSSENGPLIATLRSLQLKSLKEVSVGNKFATILDRPVYNALWPQGIAEGMLEEEEWDENETLLALAARTSDRPLRAWLGVAVDHNMLTENMAAAVHRALRERYGPSSNGSVSKGKSVNRTQPLWSPGSKPFATSSTNTDRPPVGNQRVCRQCRRDHQRCDRAAGKQCKRCLEHGWNCAESIPKSPISAKRKRLDDEMMRASSPEEGDDTVEDDEDGMEQEQAPADTTEEPLDRPSTVEPTITPEEIAETPVAPLIETDAPPQQRRSLSAASSSSKHRRQRSASTASNREEKPTLRELRTLERETQIPGSKRRRQSSAVDVALDKMGLRKTAANIAFLTEAGLISPDLNGAHDHFGLDPIVEIEADKVEHSVGVNNAETKADEDDAESTASTHDEYSFFEGGSAVGTPATISDPQMTRETSAGPTNAPASSAPPKHIATTIETVTT